MSPKQFIIEAHTKDVERMFRQLEAVILREMPRQMGAALDVVHKWVSVYPAESEANSPKYGSFGPYYRRGTGSIYRRQDGGETIVTRSERLGQSWEKRVRSGISGVRGSLRPTASYGPYVHDKEQQASFHRRRGWRTAQDAIRLKQREVTALFGHGVRLALRRLTK